MTLIVRLIITSISLCGLFATLIFLSKLNATVSLFKSHPYTTFNENPSWNNVNNTFFTPGIGSHIFRQEVLKDIDNDFTIDFVMCN